MSNLFLELTEFSEYSENMKRNEYLFDRLFTRTARILTSQRAFTLWVGYGVPPFLFGMVVVAWFQSLWFGLGTGMVAFSKASAPQGYHSTGLLTC